MRIGVDVSAVIGPPSGLRRYTEQLLQGLSEIDPSNEYIIYAAFWRDFPSRAKDFAVPKAPHFRLVLDRLPQRAILEIESRLAWRIQQRFLNRYRLDALHGVANVLPLLNRLPSTVTLHHLGGSLDSADRWSRFYFYELTKRSALAADRVIAVSEHTKREAVRLFGVDPGKVEAIWEGGAAEFFQKPHDSRRLKTLGVSAPYILFVSAINLRKNLVRLVRAFAALCKSPQFKHRLVLAGTRDKSYEVLANEVARLGIQDRVQFLEGIGQEDLKALYREADLFVYPSLLEGFGLPVLEAMTCGVPVVVSNASCLPEIAGDAALYFDGESEEDLARQISRVLSDAGLRRELIEKGKKRVTLFNWRETARKTLAVYSKIVK